MYIVPLMVAVMMSKWVGDAFIKEGMYPAVVVEMFNIRCANFDQWILLKLSQMVKVACRSMAYS